MSGRVGVGGEPVLFSPSQPHPCEYFHGKRRNFRLKSCEKAASLVCQAVQPRASPQQRVQELYFQSRPLLACLICDICSCSLGKLTLCSFTCIVPCRLQRLSSSLSTGLSCEKGRSSHTGWVCFSCRDNCTFSPSCTIAAVLCGAELFS